MKEKISEKERFFSKISHDLRGSFTSILGFSDIMNDPDEKLNENELVEFSKRIGKQSQESYELLVNFINWLKLENYDYSLSNEKIELLDIIYQLKSTFKNKLSDNSVSIDINVNELDYTFMDYEILSSILRNIFIFLITSCSANSTLSIRTVSNSQDSVVLAITALCKENKDFLQSIDLSDLNNELSFPLIFAVKFTEQIGGKFDFEFHQDGNAVINLALPKV